MSVFSDKLQAIRSARGLSQYALAKRTGLSNQTISVLEMGRRDPSWSTIQLLALALEVDCKQLADDDLSLPEQQVSQGRGRPKKKP